MGITIHEALQHQKMTAEALRQQQDTEVVHEAIESDPQVQILTEEAVQLLQNIPTDLAAAGPVAFAKHLVEAATLNNDQRTPVALIAHDMQTAWENQFLFATSCMPGGTPIQIWGITSRPMPGETSPCFLEIAQNSFCIPCRGISPREC